MIGLALTYRKTMLPSANGTVKHRVTKAQCCLTQSRISCARSARQYELDDLPVQPGLLSPGTPPRQRPSAAWAS
jgi:hypothetical protein